MLRFEWFELCGGIPDTRNPDGAVCSVHGTLLSDSRSVYDKLQRPFITPTGQSKKVDIELTRLKEAQHTVGLEIRWVNSQAMLANSLTKRGEDQQMHRFVACRQCWRIVDDPDMFSGRKLQKLGQDSLKLEAVQQTNDQSDVRNAHAPN